MRQPARTCLRSIMATRRAILKGQSLWSVLLELGANAAESPLSPLVPVKIDLVSDGTKAIPTQNVAMTATA